MDIFKNKNHPDLLKIENIYIDKTQLPLFKCPNCKKLTKNTFFKNQFFIKVICIVNIAKLDFTIHLDFAYYDIDLNKINHKH